MVLKFDLSSLPENSKIKNANVSVYMCDPMYEGTNGPKSVYRVTKSWTEEAVTFNAPWTTKGGDYAKPALAKSSNTSHNTWEEYDVTGAVRDMVENNGPNHGFLFKFDTLIPRRGSCMLSSEHSQTARRPKLAITYESGTQLLPGLSVMPELTGAGNVSIHNLQGRRVASFTVQNADRLNGILSMLPPGAHLVTIGTPDGKNVSGVVRVMH